MSRSSASRSQSPKLFAWSFFILAGLAGLNSLFITNQMLGLQKKEGRRDLASEKAPTNMVPSEDFAPTVRWNCLSGGRSSSLTTTAATARLQFQDCIGSLRVTNRTNKSQGHLFSISQGQWTSDFLSLSEGENQVEVVWNGDRQKFLILRQNRDLASSEKAL